MLLQPFIIAIFLVLNSFQLERENDLIQLTKDFLKLQNFPTKITAFLCWNKRNEVLFHKVLSQYSFTTNIYHIDKPNQIQFKLPSPEHHFFVIDVDCKNSPRILKQADGMKFFSQPFRWLVFGNTSPLKNLYFGVDSKLFIVELNNEGKYQIKASYKYSESSENINENPIAVWTKTEGILNYRKLSTSKNRTNLMGTLLKISYVVTNTDTHNHLWDYSFRHKHIDSITKVSYILMHDLTDMLNASREFIVQPTWGYKNSTTGLYSGLMGDLQQGITEIGGTPSFFTLDRIDIVDFIAAPTKTTMQFIFKAPPLSYVTNVFTLPFATTVWHYSFITVVIIAIVIYLIVIWEWCDPEFKQRIEKDPQSLRPNIFDVIMMDLGAATQQGSETEPRSLAGRIATIVALLGLMALYASYSANIVALLQSTTNSIRTLEDLVDSRIKLGAEDIVYNRYYFENTKEPVRKAIYEQKIAPKGQDPNFMSAEEGIRKVQNGLFGFHMELSNGYKIVADIFQDSEKCALREIMCFNLIEPWLSVKKNSTYKEITKVAMRKIHESGVQSRVVNKIYTAKPQCHSRGNNFESVGLIDCYFAFLLFVSGVLIALLLLLAEVFMRKYSERISERIAKIYPRN